MAGRDSFRGGVDVATSSTSSATGPILATEREGGLKALAVRSRSESRPDSVRPCPVPFLFSADGLTAWSSALETASPSTTSPSSASCSCPSTAIDMSSSLAPSISNSVLSGLPPPPPPLEMAPVAISQRWE